MKLDPKSRIKSLDLTEEAQEREDRDSWARQALDSVSSTIPIMKGIPKSEKTAHFSFIGLARLMNMGQNIAFAWRSRFHNLSEVHRAAIYIGYSMLYHLAIKYGDGDKGRMIQTYKIMQTMEAVNHDRQTMDDVLMTICDLAESKEYGAIDPGQLEEMTKRLLESLPPKLYKVVEKKISKLAQGEKLDSLLYNKKSESSRNG